MASIINLNDATPAAPAGKVNVRWQADAAPALWSTPRNVTAYVDKPATRVIGASFDGAAGATFYIGMPWACTITRWRILAIGGAATIKVWKHASGALPAAADSISTAGVSIAAGTDTGWQTTLTDFVTTAIPAGDIIGIHLHAVAGATMVLFELEVQP